MLSMLSAWQGAVIVDGNRYDSIQAVLRAFPDDSAIQSITLLPNRKPASNAPKTGVMAVSTGPVSYRITVKQYMTKKATEEFDFMQKWNNDIPMPFRTMVGTVEKETRGMVYMKLHADVYASVIPTCMKCGRPLTNPVSQYFGVGPECGGHNYVNPFGSEEELKSAVASYRKQLQKITWEGWIIKSAITVKEEVDIPDDKADTVLQ